MNKPIKIIAGVVILIIITALLFILIPRPINLVIDSQPYPMKSNAMTVGDVLKGAGITLQANDRIEPPANHLLIGVDEISYESSRPVVFQILPENAVVTISSTSRIPQELLQEAQLNLSDSDRLLYQETEIPVDQPLPYASEYRFQLKRAVEITLSSEQGSQTWLSSADTLAEALQAAGVSLGAADRLSLPLSTPLDQPLQVTIQRAVKFEVQTEGKTIPAQSAAASVGLALAEAGFPLQGLDYSIPAENEPLSAGMLIQIVRVREEITVEQSPIPFASEYQRAENVELDKTEIIQPGEYGIQVTETRIRYENDQEVSRVEETTWIAKDPVPQVVGRGAKPVVKQLETPEGTIEYWRAVSVYATSYSPCRLGTNTCSSGTASGLTVQRGVIGVTRSWYNLMVGQRVYIPGYGKAVVADIGGGIPGKYWIDLGYSDADYVQWSSYVTLYFLTPVPDVIPWILP